MLSGDMFYNLPSLNILWFHWFNLTYSIMSTTSDSKHDKEMDNNSGETFEDVVLVVEGKKIKANSGILAFSSPVFASLLRGTAATQGGKVSEPERHINMRFPSPKYEFRSESSKAVQTRIGEPLMELTIPNHKYKDIKKTLSYLVDKNGKRPMSGAYCHICFVYWLKICNSNTWPSLVYTIVRILI